MSGCRKCGQQTCTCSFIGTVTATLTGNGKSFAPINYRPNNVPLPRPYGYIRRTTNQSIGGAGDFKIDFDQEINIFSGGMADLINDRLVAPQSGYYLVFGYAAFFTVYARLWIRKNGTTNLSNQNNILPITNGTGHMAVMTLIDMVVNDYVELMVTTAGAGTIVTDDDISVPSRPVLWAQWMRGL